MDNKITMQEYGILSAAELDIAKTGTTSRKCPRCGGDIMIEEHGSSYTVCCKTDDCLKMTVHGI